MDTFGEFLDTIWDIKHLKIFLISVENFFLTRYFSYKVRRYSIQYEDGDAEVQQDDQSQPAGQLFDVPDYDQ